MNYAEQVQEAFANLASENPKEALAIACGMLVGLIEYQVEIKGYSSDEEITIDAGESGRNITLSAKAPK